MSGLVSDLRSKLKVEAAFSSALISVERRSSSSVCQLNKLGFVPPMAIARAVLPLALGLLLASPGTAQNLIRILDARVTEKDNGSGQMRFDVELERLNQDVVTVDWTTVDGTAEAPDDYQAEAGTVRFNRNQTSKTITVKVFGDKIQEMDETFSVQLSAPTNAQVERDSATGTIEDNDGTGTSALPSIFLRDVKQLEGDVGSSVLQVRFDIEGEVTQEGSFRFMTVDDTATAGDNDYTPAEGTVTIPPGATLGFVDVEILGDTRFEPDETFFVRLFSPMGVVLTDSEAVVGITNDDPSALPTLTVSNASATEGDSGTTDVTLTLRLSQAPGVSASVDFATQDGTATTADDDYVNVSGTATFGPTDTTTDVVLKINGDEEDEPDETFRLELSNPQGLELSSTFAEILIRNDDAESGEPTVSISDANVDEGNEGTTRARVKVSLSQATDRVVTVDYETRDDTATLADNDYQKSNGSVTIPVGSTVVSLDLTINGDSKAERDEIFLVVLSSPSGGILGDSVGRITIGNDDQDETGPSVSISDAAIGEGDSGITRVRLRVSLLETSGKATTFQYATEDGSATAADRDYVPMSGMVTLGAGSAEANLDFQILGDEIFEDDEVFRVRLTSSDGTLGPNAVSEITIRNDDPEVTDRITISVDDASIDEGDTTDTPISVTLRRSGPTEQKLSVDWTTEDGTATSADNDFRSASGRVAFAVGQKTTQIQLTVLGDTSAEADEVFYVRLANPERGTLVDELADITIRNDDAPPPALPELSINDVRVNEGDNGDRAVLMSVLLSEASDQSVSVRYQSEDGSATLADQDYRAAEGSLTFAPGQTQVDLRLVVIGDEKVESDELFRIRLSQPVNARIRDAFGEIVVINDDRDNGGDGGDNGDGGEEPETEARQTEVIRLSGRINQVLELDALVREETGMPVEGAIVRWSGNLTLLDGSQTRSGSGGIARQKVRLAAQPGIYEVDAVAPTTLQAWAYEITVEGSTEQLFEEQEAPNQVSVARAFDAACSQAGGDLSSTCSFVFALPADQQRDVIEQATPLELDNQATTTLGASASQTRNVSARIDQLRSGAASTGMGQLSVALRGESLSLGSLTRGLAQARARFDPEVVVAKALERLRSETPALAKQDDAGRVDPNIDRPRRWGFFLNGSLAFGDAPNTSRERGYDFETQGVTSGIDYRFSRGGFIGLAVGYVDNQNDVFDGGGETNATGTSVTLYSTWQRAGFFVDGSVAAGELDIDMQRILELPEPLNGKSTLTAIADTDSSYESATLGIGYDFSIGRSSFTGFTRGSYTQADIDGYTETGAAGFNLRINDQTVESKLLETGFEWVIPINYGWGVLQPLLRASHFHEFDNDSRAVTGGFAFDTTGSQFLILTDDPDRNFLSVGAGLTATLKRGRSLFLLYETDLERDDLDSSKVSLGFRQQF